MLLNDQRNSSCKDDVLSPVKVDGYELCDDVNLRACLCDRWCGVYRRRLIACVLTVLVLFC